MADVDWYEMRMCVRGYHVYQQVWEAAHGEMLVCSREARNRHDRYTVAVEKNGTVIRHLPKKFSRVCSLFLKHGGRIQCTVTGKRRYSADLKQGGLEIPAPVLFKARLKKS